jgi:hypothetical protein
VVILCSGQGREEEEMTFRHRFLIGLLAVANLIIAGYLISHHHASEKTGNPVTIKKPQNMPLLKLKDYAGEELYTGQFIGKPIFVLFINPHVEAQVDAYVTVRTQQLNQPVSWLLISSDARELRQKLSRGNNDPIVENEYDKLRDLFGVSKCCEEWLIFDSRGNLKDSGKYDEGGAAGRLKYLVDGDLPYSTNVLFKALNSASDKGFLKQLHARAARSQSKKAVIVLFSSACTGCSEDYLIDLLRTGAKKSPEIAFMALLPNTFSRSDVETFKTNLEIPFVVELADAELSRQWLAINEKYGWKAANGSVVVVSGGKIISVVNGLKEAEQVLEELARKI